MTEHTKLRKPDSTDAMLGMLYKLVGADGIRLAPDALIAFRDIAEATIGNFATRAAKLDVPDHPWSDEVFRSFILGQVERIADVLRDDAEDAPVSAKALHAAAFEVMSETNMICRSAAEKGRLKFELQGVPKAEQGEMCTDYLRVGRFAG